MLSSQVQTDSKGGQTTKKEKRRAGGTGPRTSWSRTVQGDRGQPRLERPVRERCAPSAQNDRKSQPRGAEVEGVPGRGNSERKRLRQKAACCVSARECRRGRLGVTVGKVHGGSGPDWRVDHGFIPGGNGARGFWAGVQAQNEGWRLGLCRTPEESGW